MAWFHAALHAKCPRKAHALWPHGLAPPTTKAHTQGMRDACHPARTLLPRNTLSTRKTKPRHEAGYTTGSGLQALQTPYIVLPDSTVLA